MNRCSRCGIEPWVSVVNPEPLCEYCLQEVSNSGIYRGWFVRQGAGGEGWRARSDAGQVVGTATLPELVRGVDTVMSTGTFRDYPSSREVEGDDSE